MFLHWLTRCIIFLVSDHKTFFAYLNSLYIVGGTTFVESSLESYIFENIFVFVCSRFFYLLGSFSWLNILLPCQPSGTRKCFKLNMSIQHAIRLAIDQTWYYYLWLLSIAIDFLYRYGSSVPRASWRQENIYLCAMFCSADQQRPTAVDEIHRCHWQSLSLSQG